MDNHIPYRFTPIPTHLFMCLDNNCRSVLFALIQLSSYYADDNGWFFRSNADLEAETNLSPKVIIGALHALFIEGIIEVIPQQKGRGIKQESRKYKVNFGKFLEYEKISLDDCMKNSDYMIETSDYKHGPLPFQRTSPPSSVQTSVQTSTPTSAQSTNNIEKIEKEENIDNILTYNNIYNIEEPNGNSIPNGDYSSSSFVEGLCDNPTDNTAIDGSCSFSFSNPTCSSEPDGNRTTSLSLPTCSISSSDSPTTSSPEGESSNPEKLEQIIPREKEISSQQPSDSNASEGTVSVSVPSQFEDGDSCATSKYSVEVWEKLKAAHEVLYEYDSKHLPFDEVSGQAFRDAVSLCRQYFGYDYNRAKTWVMKVRKEAVNQEEQQHEPEPTPDLEPLTEEMRTLRDKIFIDPSTLEDDDCGYAW